MAANALPFILLAGAAFFLMGKKGGEGSSDESDGDGEGDGDGASTGLGTATAGGVSAGASSIDIRCNELVPYIVNVSIWNANPNHTHPPVFGPWSLKPKDLEGQTSISWNLGPTPATDWKEHRHEVILDEDQISELLTKGTINVQSKAGWMTTPAQADTPQRLGHTHNVTLTCHKGPAPASR